MSDFATFPVHAPQGGKIQVAAGCFKVNEATAMLFSESQYREFERATGPGIDDAWCEYTQRITLSPDSPTQTVIVPEAGLWFVVFTSSEVLRARAALLDA
jgi:hypothetical protein